MQPRVLALELLEPLRLLDLKAAVRVPPAIVALLGNRRLFAGLADGSALCHEHLDRPQLRDDLFGVFALLGHLPGFLSKLIISISLAQENPVRSELVPKLEEADRLAEIAHQKYLAEVERYRREEDQRQVEKSIKESREHLGRIITKWSEMTSVANFLKGVDAQAAALPEDQRTKVQERH